METITELEQVKGHGTSLITLLIPGNGNLCLVRKKIMNEMGTAKNIKDRVNRHSVQGALKKCLDRLKLYKTLPSSGLAILSGTYI